jgi:Tol biopolymer transport system component
MHDVRNDLRRTAQSFGSPSHTLERLAQRKTRREARRRIVVVVTAFAVAALSTSLLWSSFRPGQVPGAGPRIDPPTLPGNGLISFTIGEMGGRMEGFRFAVVRTDGSNQLTIVDGSPQGANGGWSADGSSIVFSRDPIGTPDGDIGIWTVNADGSGLTQLTDGRSMDYGAQWSPDGARILFDRYAGGPPGEPRGGVFVMNADGSDLHRIVGDPGVGYMQPRWSPDGSRILFLTNNPEGEGYGLWVVNSDGTRLKQLYSGPCGSPQWSPSGGLILFQTGNRLVTVDANGGEPTTLLGGLGGDVVFQWSPDGSRIVYDRPIDPRQGEQLWVAPIDGSEPTLVAEHLQWRDPDPVWSPDGTSIAFVRDGNIWTAQADGGTERQVTDTPAYEHVEGWGAAVS